MGNVFGYPLSTAAYPHKKEKSFSLPLEFTAPAAVETNLGSDTGTTAGKLETSWDVDKQAQIITLVLQIILIKA